MPSVNSKIKTVFLLSFIKTRIMMIISIRINNKINKTIKITNKSLSKPQTQIHKQNAILSVFPMQLSNKLQILPMFLKLKNLVKLQELSKDKLIKNTEMDGMSLSVKTLGLMSPTKEVHLCTIHLKICTFVYFVHDDL